MEEQNICKRCRLEFPELYAGYCQYCAYEFGNELLRFAKSMGVYEVQ